LYPFTLHRNSAPSRRGRGGNTGPSCKSKKQQHEMFPERSAVTPKRMPLPR
jgi:hypothetical protein